MPAIVKVDRQRRIVISTFHGDVTDAEIVGHRESIRTDPDFDPTFAEIADFSAARVAITPASLSALAGTESIFSKQTPHVIVAPAGMPFALAQRYRELARASRPNLFVVSSVAEALSLLRDRGYDDESKTQKTK